MGFVLWLWVTEEQREYIRNTQVRLCSTFFVWVGHETIYGSGENHHFWSWFLEVCIFFNSRSFTFHILSELWSPFSIWTYLFHFFFNFFYFLNYFLILSRSHFEFLPNFSLHYVIIRTTKIINRANKNWGHF